MAHSGHERVQRAQGSSQSHGIICIIYQPIISDQHQARTKDIKRTLINAICTAVGSDLLSNAKYICII